jgi:endonuclease-3
MKPVTPLRRQHAGKAPRGKSGPDAHAIVSRLAAAYPGATTELHYRTPFELLVATILSAQSTDVRVNEVTSALFARYPNSAALAAARIPDVERLVQPTGFFRMKARALVSMSQRLMERHGGDVPASMDALVGLPGVGRKTANVVLGHALGVPGLPVDRHVLRVSGRLGFSRGKTPEQVEQELCAQLPPEMWTLASDCLILHGRRVCRPHPLCHTCMITEQCAFFRRYGAEMARASVKQARPRRGKAGATEVRPARQGVGRAGSSAAPRARKKPPR